MRLTERGWVTLTLGTIFLAPGIAGVVGYLITGNPN